MVIKTIALGSWINLTPVPHGLSQIRNHTSDTIEIKVSLKLKDFFVSIFSYTTVFKGEEGFYSKSFPFLRFAEKAGEKESAAAGAEWHAKIPSLSLAHLSPKLSGAWF